jgi:glutamate dehydrogenase
MQEDFKDEITSHPLKKEIITNYIVNTIINRIGINFILNLMEKSGTSIEDIVNAYFIIRDSYGLRKVWHSFEYEYKFPNNASKILAFTEIRKYTSYIISRFLRVPCYNLSDLSKNISELGGRISYSIENFESLISKKSFQYYQKKCNEYKKYILEEECYGLLAKISGLIFIPSIIHIARKKNINFDLLVKIYFLIEDKLDSRVLRKHISKFLISGGLYQEVSIAILLDDIASEHSNIVEFIIEKYQKPGEEICPEELIGMWLKDYSILLENYSKIKIKNLELNEFDYSFLILLLNRIKLLHN